jgi:hypothetical protein
MRLKTNVIDFVDCEALIIFDFLQTRLPARQGQESHY